MTDLVNQLRSGLDNADGNEIGGVVLTMNQAAARIEQLEAQLAKADALAERAAEYAAMQCDTYELASAAMAYRKARGNAE